MRIKKTKKTKVSRASVSIMLSFLMLPVYTFAGAVVDGARVSSAKQMVAGAANLTLNAGLADYNDVLKSVYGLFAMSSSEEELQNNLSDYFHRTVNNTALSETDEESRKYIESIGSFFSDPSNADFDNLINLSASDFTAKYTDGAVLANPVVLKNQITEYMKYIGPVSMGRGFISKLGVFKDFEGQNEVVDAKIEYDKSLEQIKKICQNIYDNASAYNRCLEENTISDSETTKKNIERVRTLYIDAIKYLILSESPEHQVSQMNFSKETEKSIKKMADEKKISVFQCVSEELEKYINIDRDNSFSLKETEFTSNLHLLSYIPGEDDSEYVREVYIRQDQNSDFVRVFSMIEMYKKYFDDLSDKQKEEKGTEKDIYSDISEEMIRQCEDACSVKSDWINKVNSLCSEAAGILEKLQDNSSEVLHYLYEVKSSLEKLTATIDECEKKGEDWQDAINALSDGEVKTVMQSDYDISVSAMSKEDIREYLNVTEENIDSFEKLSEYYDIRFYEKKISESCNYYEKYSSLVPCFDVKNFSDAYNMAVNQINDNYSVPEGEIPSSYTKQGSEYAFYRYLAEICGSDYTSPSDKKSAEDFLETVNSIGNPEESMIPENVKSDIESVISEDKMERILKAAETPEETGEFEIGVSDPDAESMLENQQNITNSTSKFLKGVAELADAAETGLEKLYLTEYITEMFSCYTSDIEDSDGKEKSKTFTGCVLSEENNPFYRAEVEYILWGKENMEQNIKYTEALIFGTRFAFNNIYAFTDSEIRTTTLTAATAIAGWTGFGVPVVQTVLTMSLALAESASDMNILLKGGAVPVYKTSATWYMKPSGLINALRNNSDELAKMAAEKTGKAVDDIFSKLEKSADEGIDKLTGTFNEYADSLAEEAVDSAVNTVNNVVQNILISVLDNLDSGCSQESIEAILNERIDSIYADDSNISSVALKTAKKLAKENVGKISALISEKCSTITSGTKEKVETVRSETAEQINKIIESLRDSVKESIGHLAEALKEQTSAGISVAGDYASEYAQDMVTYSITGMSSALTEKYNSKDVPVFSGKKNANPVGCITLTYKEYLKIFVMLNTMSENKERSVLTRTAVLIDINISNGMKNAEINGETLANDPDFDISAAHTMLEVNTSATVKTWFLGLLVPDFSGDDNEDDSEEIVDELKKEKKIKYRDLLSY